LSHLLIKIINNILSFIVISIIKGYKLFISPILPSSCRYSPTCSSYAISAYKRYDFIKATFLTIRRILRCNPLFKGGYDPLPDDFSFKKGISRSING